MQGLRRCAGRARTCSARRRGGTEASGSVCGHVGAGEGLDDSDSRRSSSEAWRDLSVSDNARVRLVRPSLVLGDVRDAEVPRVVVGGCLVARLGVEVGRDDGQRRIDVAGETGRRIPRRRMLCICSGPTPVSAAIWQRWLDGTFACAGATNRTDWRSSRCRKGSSRPGHGCGRQPSGGDTCRRRGRAGAEGRAGLDRVAPRPRPSSRLPCLHGGEHGRRHRLLDRHRPGGLHAACAAGPPRCRGCAQRR